MKTLIVEDERVVARDISNILKALGYANLSLAYTFSDALSQIATDTPDFIILDINLSDTHDGIDLAKIIRDKYDLPFVFLTSYADKATLERAKWACPNGYLVKPFTEESLLATLEIGWHNFQNKPVQPSEDHPTVSGKFFFVKDAKGSQRLYFDDVLCLEADDNYSHIHTLRKKHTLRASLKELLEQFPAQAFLQVHRSFVINMTKLDSFNAREICLEGDIRVPLSRSYRDDFMQRIKVVSRLT